MYMFVRTGRELTQKVTLSVLSDCEIRTTFFPSLDYLSIFIYNIHYQRYNGISVSVRLIGSGVSETTGRKNIGIIR